jgi:transaldolase
LAGSDIQTNPPGTNEAVEKSTRRYTRQVDKMPPNAVVEEIRAKVDVVKMEKQLMEEGLAKFSEPHRALLTLIRQKRSSLAASGR